MALLKQGKVMPKVGLVNQDSVLTSVTTHGAHFSIV